MGRARQEAARGLGEPQAGPSSRAPGARRPIPPSRGRPIQRTSRTARDRPPGPRRAGRTACDGLRLPAPSPAAPRSPCSPHPQQPARPQSRAGLTSRRTGGRRRRARARSLRARCCSWSCWRRPHTRRRAEAAEGPSGSSARPQGCATGWRASQAATARGGGYRDQRGVSPAGAAGGAGAGGWCDGGRGRG